MNSVLVVTNFSAGRKQAIKYHKNIQKFLLRKQFLKNLQYFPDFPNTVLTTIYY